TRGNGQRDGAAVEEAARRGIPSYLRRTSEHVIYYTRKLRYFVAFLDFVPGIRDQQGQKLDPSELKELRLESASERDCLLAALNSGGVGKVTRALLIARRCTPASRHDCASSATTKSGCR